MPIRALSRSTAIRRSSSCYGRRVRGPTFRPLAVALVTAAPLAAQGVTTAAVQGTVTSQDGMPIAAATVSVTNISTGQRWQVETRAGGRYFVEGVAVGGPYNLDARGVGFRSTRRTAITLELGQRYV